MHMHVRRQQRSGTCNFFRGCTTNKRPQHMQCDPMPVDSSKSAHCGQRWLCHNPSFKAMSWFPALQTLFLLYATSKIATTVATNGLRGIHYIVSGHGCIRSGNGRVPQLNPSSGPAILRLSVAGSPVVLNENDWASTFFSFFEWLWYTIDSSVKIIHFWLNHQSK